MPGCSAVNCRNRTENGHKMFVFPRDPERRRRWLQNSRRDKWEPTNSSFLCQVPIMTGCSAVNCKNQSGPFRLFRFPSDPVRRQKWLRNTRRDKWQPTRNSALCNVHFADDQFESHRADGWRKLKPNAIPTIFNFPDRPKKRKKLTSYEVPETANIPEERTTLDQPASTVSLLPSTAARCSFTGYDDRGEQYDPSQTSDNPEERTDLDQPASPVSLPPSIAASPPRAIAGLEHYDSCGPCNHFQKLQSLREENLLLREENVSLREERVSLREENVSLKQQLAALKENLSKFLDEEKQDAVSLGKALVESWSRDKSVEGFEIGFALGLYPSQH